MTPEILDAGDGAFMIRYGDGIDSLVNARVNALARAVDSARGDGRLSCILEVVPTFNSLLVVIDPLARDADEVRDSVLALAGCVGAGSSLAPARRWVIPVCYDDELGPDLGDAAAALGLSADVLAASHAEAEYVVYMLGFMPGFAYMGGLPEHLQLPRRATPRTRVPAGSVAMAQSLCAIYPWDSPGGWHLLGRTPVKMFSLSKDRPSLLAPGDRVRFRPIPRALYDAVLSDPSLAPVEEEEA